MRILILGGSGMLGHKLWQRLSARFPDTHATIRGKRSTYARYGIFTDHRVIEDVDALDFSRLAGIMGELRPDFILNCVGVTKRREQAGDPIPSIELNALLPHRLAAWGASVAAKVVNFSTDCVFNGRTGNYREEIGVCPDTRYGMTKALGDEGQENLLTLRSSFIGPELHDGTELLAWFLSQKGAVKGYRNAIFSGFTTLELSRIVEKMLLEHPDATGLYHVSSRPISKFDLLTLIRDGMHRDVEIVPDDTFHCDRSLDSAKFRREFGYVPPTWESMIEELCTDITGGSYDF